MVALPYQIRHCEPERSDGAAIPIPVHFGMDRHAFFIQKMLAMTLSIFMILFSLSAHAYAEDSFEIVAVVNDDVISSMDVADRTSLVLGTTGQPDLPEIRKQFRKKVTQQLIDETLKLQAAERNSILIAQDDIDGAIARIEQSQKKPSGSLEGSIRSKDLPIDSFYRQIKGEVAWSKILSRKVRQDVVLSDDEVFRTQQRLARGKKMKELQIASIILPKTQGLSDEQTLGIARDIRSQLVNGADAPSLIKQYYDRIPLEFGPLTWVQRELLNPDISQAIRGAAVGTIAEPIKTPAGYQIIRILDERTTTTNPGSNSEVAVKQIVLKLSDVSQKNEVDAMMGIARSVAKYPGSCTETGLGGLKDIEGLDIDVNFIRTTLKNMAPDIRAMLDSMRVTQITEPFATPDGIHLLMLCERIDIPAPLPKAEEVKQVLFQEKMELEAEKYLRTLRREAFIDIRS